MNTVSNPRFFIYENKIVKEVNESQYLMWVNSNWHPGHLHHSMVNDSKNEVWLGFQGHYKYCEWNARPFNVTYFIYGNEIRWKEVHNEYFSTYEEALMRYNEIIEGGFQSSQLNVSIAA